MGFSPDVLVATLQEVLPGYTETFTTFHPAFEAIIAKGQKRKANGPWIEFGLVPGAPGQVTTLRSGTEVIAGGRRQDAERANAYAATMIYAWDVPGQDLREANGKADLLDLIKKYPERALDDFQDQLARQLVAGGEADVGAMLTFNSDANYDPKGLGSQPGIFEWVAPTSQGDTVFGIQKNSVKNWHHQYANISSFATDGRQKLAEAYYDASVQGGRSLGDVDLMFADRGTYHNYLSDLDDQLRIVDNDLKKGDRRPSAVRAGVKFMGATMHLEHEIKTGASGSFSSSAPQNGVVYGIHSGTWHLFSQGSDAKMETAGDFAFRGPDYLVTQDMWRYQYVLSLGMYCDNLRCNFAVTGGATA